MDRLDRLGWAVHDSFLVGNTLLGVRSNDERFSRALSEALAQHHRQEAITPANYSVMLPSEGDGPRLKLAALHRAHHQVLRTSSPMRLIRALLSHLDARAQNGHLRLTLAAAIKDGRAVLVPGDVANLPQSLVRRLEAEKIRIHDAYSVAVDLERARLVLPEIALDLDPAALVAVVGDGSVLPMSGEFELKGMVETSSPEGGSTLYRVAQAVRTSPNCHEFGTERAVDGLIGLFDALPIAVAQGRGRELADAVALLFR